MGSTNTKRYCPHCNIRLLPLVTGEGVTFYTCPGCRRQTKAPKPKHTERAKLWARKSEAALKRPAVKKLFDAYAKLKRAARKAHFEITREFLYGGIDKHTAKQKHNDVKAKVRAAFNAYQSAVWKVEK